jgi:hypothetical protein
MPHVCARCGQPLSNKDVNDQHGWCESCWTSPVTPPDAPAPPNFVDARALDSSADPTFIDVNGATVYHLFMRGFVTEAIMPSIRCADRLGEEFFFTRVLRSSDGRWFARGGFAASRREWQKLVRRGFAYDELIQISPAQAAVFLRRAGVELPPDLDKLVQTMAMGGIERRTAEKKTEALAGEAQDSSTPMLRHLLDKTVVGAISESQVSPLSITLTGKVEHLPETPDPLSATLALIPLAPLKRNAITFLYSKSQKTATFTAIALQIYKAKDKNSLTNTRLLIKRTRAILEERDAPLRLVTENKYSSVSLIDRGCDEYDIMSF